jgi:hypothetical protein
MANPKKIIEKREQAIALTNKRAIQYARWLAQRVTGSPSAKAVKAVWGNHKQVRCVTFFMSDADSIEIKIPNWNPE